MTNLRKLAREIAERDPELKQMLEENDKYKRERKQYHLDNGDSEEVAAGKMWGDFWDKANQEDGVEFSIRKLSE